MVRILSGLVLVWASVTITGCSGEKLPTAPDVPRWEALDKLTSGDTSEAPYGVAISAEHKDWKAVGTEAGSAGYKALVEAFASSEIPGKFATDARKKAKEQAAKDLRALVAAGESKASPKQIEAAYKKAMSSLAAVRKADE